ncbi:MAG TPA: site-specific integrase [Firmicutes bacterium]|nr:site-specific integrase [Bacillota bacterium]
MSKRRGHGEGSIYQRKDGRWCATVTVGRDATGKPKRRYIYGRTRKEVQEQLTKLLADAQGGLPIDVTKQTVGQFLLHWLNDTVRGSRAPKTYLRYESTINTHLIPALSNIPLAKLAPQHLLRLYRELQDAGGHDKAHKCHATLHCALSTAVKLGLIPRNPADLVDAPRVERKEMRVLTPEETARLFDAARGDRYYALYVLAATCGLRLGELLGLKWQDIDFDAGTLQVQRQLQWITGAGPTFKEPKTKGSRRTIYLPRLAIDALKEHRKRQAAERLKLGEVWQAQDLVFPSEIGTPANPSNIYKWSWHPILEKAGLPRIRIHDLRHTAASLLLLANENPRVVQELLGHSDISTTLGIYSHILPSMKQRVAATMDRILSPQPEQRRVRGSDEPTVI